MHKKLLSCLCCPSCKSELKVNDYKDGEGSMHCILCTVNYDIKNGIPDLIYPRGLSKDLNEQQVLNDRGAAKYRWATFRWLIKRGILAVFFENRIRRRVIDRLDLHTHKTLLETGCGDGVNLAITAELHPEVQLWGMDLSKGVLDIAKKNMLTKSTESYFVQANAEELPFKNNLFDAVLHIGSINNFPRKKHAIEEMCRVAKPSSKIVICDEGLNPDKENTLHGK